MHSPVPFSTEEPTNTHYESFPPILTNTSAHFSPKKRQPARPGTSNWQLDEKLPACGRALPGATQNGFAATTTGFGVSNRGHMSGAGHTVVGGLARCATAAVPPKYCDANFAPPPASASTATRKGSPQQAFYDRPPTGDHRPPTGDHRPPTGDSWGNGFAQESDPLRCTTGAMGFNARRSQSDPQESDPRRCTTGFNGTRKSVDASKGANISGMDSVQRLDDIKCENRLLRDELSRLQCAEKTAFDNLPQRRPMAMIAGGGFRGPSQTQTKSTCMCDALKSQLSKVRAELREAREENRLPSRSFTPPQIQTRDNASQTFLEPAPDPAPEYQPPQTAPSTFSGAPRIMPRSGGFIDAPAQTDSTIMVDACMQAVPRSSSHAEAQTAPPPSSAVHLGVQAGSGLCEPSRSSTETQTAEPPRPGLLDTGSQADPIVGSEVAVQAGGLVATCSDSTAQTDAQPLLSPSPIGVEVEVQCIAAEAAAIATQTEQLTCADAACEANFQVKPDAKKQISAASQTIPPAGCVAAVQTKKPKATGVATQASPPLGVDHASQAEDGSLDAALKHVAEGEKLNQDLEARLVKLSMDLEAANVDKNKAQEASKLFQQMAQTKAFGQLNVTILCPRAECTVSGERIEMDSWNPQRLRDEFEREVLPRFTRVFVEEATKGGKQRSEAVDRAMQDFAETFRERLSGMLSAPNAAAAVQAAASAPKGR